MIYAISTYILKIRKFARIKFSKAYRKADFPKSEQISAVFWLIQKFLQTSAGKPFLRRESARQGGTGGLAAETPKIIGKKVL